MIDTTLVALVVLGGIFALMAIAIHKAGIDGATKVWSLLGVAFGAIVSFYFTDGARQKTVHEITAQTQAEVAKANDKAAAATTLLNFRATRINSDDEISKIIEDLKNRPSSMNQSLLQDKFSERLLVEKNLDKAITDFQRKYNAGNPGSSTNK
jgi:hypothetical protein